MEATRDAVEEEVVRRRRRLEEEEETDGGMKATEPTRDAPTSRPHSHVSISADANFPVAPKWIRMNFP